jgi:hypothetical protein
MMKMISIMVISCFCFSCHANEKKSKASDTLPKKSIAHTRIEQLKRAFEQKDYPTFFKLFPDTYSELLGFYGFDDSTGESPLYSLYDTHIDYLFEYSNKISSETFASKVYEVAKGGVWDADAVGLFQSHLSKLIINNPNVFFEILNNKSDKEAASFWYFVLDSPHPNNDQNKEFVAILSKQYGVSNKQILILKKQFEKVKADEVH